jgi:hypothetical protein
MLAKAKLYEPGIDDRNTPEAAVKSVLSVVESSEVSKGIGGVIYIYNR